MITLPLPPSINATYKRNANNFYKSNEAKAWEEEAGYILMQYRPQKPLLGALFCQIDLFLKRDRDVDGSNKLVIDLLEKMKFFENDSQIEHLNIKKFVDKKNPRLEIQIEKMG